MADEAADNGEANENPEEHNTEKNPNEENQQTLEAKVKEGELTIEELEKRLAEKELPEELESLVRMMLEKKAGSKDAKKSERESRTLKEWIDEAFYVAMGFLEPGENKDPYEAVARMEGTVVVLLPGLFHWPNSAEAFRKYSGLNVVRFDERSPEALQKFLSYVYDKTGNKSVVIPFSDGEERLEAYLKKCGDDLIALAPCIGAKKNADKYSKNGKVFYINGEWDCLAPLEKGYHIETKAPVFTVPGSHGGLMKDEQSIKATTAIIKDRAFAAGIPLNYVPVEMYKWVN